MPVEANLEREYKFDVDTDYRSPDMEVVSGPTERLPDQRLVTTYLDTDDLRLWAHGITLRHRLEHEDGSGPAGPPDPGKWTLKLPEASLGPAQQKARTEFSCRGGAEDVPPELIAIVAGLLRRRPLMQIVVLAAERRRLLLNVDAAGPAWAEIDDDLVEVTAGNRLGFRFRQLELEMLGGSGSPTVRGRPERVVRALHEAGAVPGGGSKFALASGLPETRLVDELPAGADVVSVVEDVLRRDLDRLLAVDYRLRVPDERGDPARPAPALVRAAGLAVRRLRSDLKLLGGLLDGAWTEDVRSDLAWIGRRLGRLATEDLLLDRVSSPLDSAGGEAIEGEAAEELAVLLTADRHLGAIELHDVLASEQYMALLDRLAADRPSDPVRAGVAGRGADALGQGLARRWRRARRAAGHVGAEGPAPGWAGRLRRRSEELADAADTCRPYIGPKVGRLGRTAAEVAGTLDRLRATRTAVRDLRELARHPSMPAGVVFVAGRMAGRAEAEADHLNGEAARSARRLARFKAGSWMAD